jgi:hypothetical protein
MKTPEEIKKGLKCRKRGYAETCNRNCQDCTMFIPNYSISERYSDALAYIQQLESRLAQAELERDAAVADLAEGRNCADCKHYYESVFDEPCSSCIKDEETKKGWQWRGVCAENTKEETI